MPRKPLEALTESMFYVLMAFLQNPLCGIDVAAYIEKRTEGRLQIGPATLYTILGKFEKEKFIEETEVDGRKRTYQITKKGQAAYMQELERIKCCLADAQSEEDEQKRGKEVAKDEK